MIKKENKETKTATIEDAVSIAAQAHKGVKDKAGAAYILHPLRMMMRLRSEAEMMTAILHDVVAKMVPISKLIQAKIHVADPDVLSGKKPHPVFKAYSYFLILSGMGKDPLVVSRKPITVTSNSDGTYNIVDGSATVQAAIFVDWKSVPVIVTEETSEGKSKH